LDLTDGNLSRHLRVLEEVQFVKIEKVFEDRRPRTWISATTRGRAAFASEVKALEALIKGARRRSAGQQHVASRADIWHGTD
jgi:DNA-binding MarR family transcriptional regulator